MNTNNQHLLTICIPVYGTQIVLLALPVGVQEEVASFNEKLPLFLFFVYNLRMIRKKMKIRDCVVRLFKRF